MDIDEFDGIFREVRASHATTEERTGFPVFDLWRATEPELASAELILGTRLPAAYREFMLRYGGGQFLFIDIYPIVARSGKNIDGLVGANRHSWSDPSFVVVSPVGSGDEWGFSSADGVCEDRVSCLDHEDGSREVWASDFFAFVVRCGLSPYPRREEGPSSTLGC
jgi:SMI1-KNR4 cell-wall